MTEIPYPPSPAPGSNAIGVFEIGVSQVGTIPPFNWIGTVISQYGNSPILLQLIENFNNYVDLTKNFDDFYDKIWNVITAQGIGLDIWGRIVGVNRVLQISTSKFFGFEEAGNAFIDPFNVSPFYTGTMITDNFALSDEAYRTLILAKAFANISDGSTASINQLLLTLFPNRGNAYVVDNNDMTIEYAFAFTLNAVEYAIVTNSGVLPKPTGVLATVTIP